MARQKLAQAVAPAEQSEPRDTGPWYRITAKAKYSLTYDGKVDHGTYTQKEKDKGVVGRRVQSLEAEGYTGIEVREITTGGDE